MEPQSPKKSELRAFGRRLRPGGGFSTLRPVTTRGTLLIIGLIIWLAALGFWLRGNKDGRFRKEGLLFFFLGLPFLVAGGFYTASSYPQEVVAPTPTPPPPSTPIKQIAVVTPTPAPTPPLPRAEPMPTPADPKKAYEQAVDSAQRLAVDRYPELGFAGTGFNAEFVAAYHRKKAEQPDFFQDPNWPITLADEVGQRLGPR